MTRASEYELRIELVSDMCCGTGEASGIAVDTLTAVDEHGLPVIPAKRLKGLLRESAELVCCGRRDLVEQLFGKSGVFGGKLRFSMAELEGAGALKDLIAKKGVSAVQTTRAFTGTRTGTAVEPDGTARDHSLRTVQVVRAKNAEGEPTVFTGVIFGEDLTQEEEELLTRAARCLRSIGMSKTRGLGEVVSSIEPRSATAPAAASAAAFEGDAEEIVTAGYTLSLESDLILSGGIDSALDYVPGSMIQGVFAAMSAKDDEELLRSDVLRRSCFSNAYLVIDAGGQSLSSRPVPNTYKGVKNEDCNPGSGTQLTLYDHALDEFLVEGQQQVALKGYCAQKDGVVYVAAPDSALSFHSSKASSLQGKQFYSLAHLRAGQCFAGTITARRGALQRFQELLAQRGNKVSLGTSTRSGYGLCAMELGPEQAPEMLSVKPGDRVEAALLSDTVIVREDGSQATGVAELLEAVKTLSPAFAACQVDDGDTELFAKVTTIGGYNAHWKLPKPQRRAFQRGSVLVLRASADAEINVRHHLGILAGEGCGLVQLRVLPAQAEPSRYEKAAPYVQAARQDNGTAGERAAASFEAELQYAELIERCRELAYGLADALRRGELSKSSAMRMGNILATATKAARAGKAKEGLERCFEQLAEDNFKGRAELIKKCRALVQGFGDLYADSGFDLSAVRRDTAFARFIQAYLHYAREKSVKEGADND